MSEGDELRALIQAADGLARSSDTFKWLTGDAAAQLAERAAKRQNSLDVIEAAVANEHPVGVGELGKELDSARSEVEFQVRLAAWLRQLGDDGGDA